MSANLEQHNDRLLVLRVGGELKKSELDAVQSEFVEKIVGAGTVKLLVLLENFTGWERGEQWGDTGELQCEDKARAKEALQTGVGALTELQDMLYGQDRWSLLLIFQAMDAAGKDGTIKHVMSGVNPQGCQVSSFKAPTSEDLDHDYLWRCQKALPERGRIGIFNRSYYEETLVVRVHPELLAGQKLPERCVTKRIWDERFQDIRAFERYLTRNGTIVRKFVLYVSKEEQQKRFLERIDLPEKNWKFSANDAKEREFWDDYMMAYEETIRE